MIPNSPHALTNIEKALVSPVSEGGFEWDPGPIETYLEVLLEIAESSGGGVNTPTEVVTDCADFEDNRILELAIACQAILIISNDSDLLHMTPWRGIPAISIREFAARVDAARRARRRLINSQATFKGRSPILWNGGRN